MGFMGDGIGNQSLVSLASQVRHSPWRARIIALAIASALTGAASGGDPQEGNVADDLHYARSLSRAFREVAKRVGPSVVAITTIDRPPFATEHRSEGRGRQRGEVRGEGTGVILSEDGLIITNNHVVSGGDEVTVRLFDGRKFQGTIVGTDRETDLAVVRIAATKLQAASFGNSREIETGDWVLAIGSPFGFEHSVTAGIVSAKSRDGLGLSTFEEYIQTDAAINPGNSGGPLIDLDGKVVGINSGIASQTGGSSGVGFAIPSHVVQKVAESIAQVREVRRGWLGVSTRELDRDLAKSVGHDSTDGVLVAGVVPGTPAARAGIEVGDIIVAIDGEATPTRAHFMRTIANCTPEEPVALGVIRDGKTITTHATLGERPSPDSKLVRGGESTNSTSVPQPVAPTIEDSLGLEIRVLDPDSTTALGATGGGLRIERVRDGSPALLAGLKRGDVIREVDGFVVETIDGFRTAIAKSNSATTTRIIFERDRTKRLAVLQPTP